MSFLQVRIVALVVILICGAIGGLVFQSIANKSGGLVTVYVASKDVLANVVLKDDDVKTIDYPEKFLPKDAVFDKTKVVGKYTNFSIVEGQIMQEKLVSQNKTLRERLLSYGEDYTAIPLLVTSIDYPLNLMQVGDSVSIIDTSKESKSGIYLAEHLPVLDVITANSSILILCKRDDVPNLIKSMESPHRIVIDAKPYEISEAKVNGVKVIEIKNDGAKKEETPTTSNVPVSKAVTEPTKNPIPVMVGGQ